MLHSPSEVQKTVAPSAEGICQVKPKKIAVKVVAGSVAARMDVRLVKDGCTSFPSTGDSSGENMEQIHGNLR